MVEPDLLSRASTTTPSGKRIVWQYGHTGVADSNYGCYDKPDGIALAPADARFR